MLGDWRVGDGHSGRREGVEDGQLRWSEDSGHKGTVGQSGHGGERVSRVM